MISEEEAGCANCKRSNPTKRCAKRHAKCLTKLFCDSVCEKAAHQKKNVENVQEIDENIDTAKPMGKSKELTAAEKKKKADKKAKKKPNQGTTRCSGEFWWA